MKLLFRRHPLLSYFAMAFAISWVGIACAAAMTEFNLASPQPVATGLFFVAMLLGPCLSGLMLTALMDGRPGLRQLGSRLLRWRVGIGWYAIVLLIAPLLLLSVLWSFSALASPTYTPQFHWTLLAIGLIAGAFEEIGWTGFATPRLLARGDAWSAGLRLGLIWAMWHTLVVFLFTFGAMGQGWIISFIIVYIATLTPYRILMTWVYANTKSVFLAALMHASYTGWLLALFPATSPAQSLIWQLAFAAALWMAALLVRRRPARRLDVLRRSRILLPDHSGAG
ncbi:MAG: CPBP family intramembrane glutamic endopeptidase [Caulobacterales bacterium]